MCGLSGGCDITTDLYYSSNLLNVFDTKEFIP